MRESELQSRARALTWTVGLLAALIALRAVDLQVVHGRYWAEQARDNRQVEARVLAPRGEIFDRTGTNLVQNVYQARITYPRRYAVPGDSTLARLVRLLELDESGLFERIDRAPPGDRVTLVRRATPEQVAIVEEHRGQLRHVRAEVEPRRHARFESLAAHAIGRVGEVRPEETGPEAVDPREDQAYRLGDVIGRDGVEAAAETLLRGRNGRRVVMVSAAGHLVGELPNTRRAVTPGWDVFLTLHQGLQARVEELLAGKAGAAVVVEIATGDLLAIASAPTYDPNEFTRGISQARFDEIRLDPRKPLFNRVTKGVYPPGSPFKLITAAAALERGRVDPRERFDPCFGGYRFGDRWFGCWKPAGHGSLDLNGAIVQSCDTYFYQLVQRLSVDELAETARAFGFGSSTGLAELEDSEGLVPGRVWYDEKMGAGRWSRGVRLNLAIGQGELLVTPLQMALAYAAIGGDGHLRRPNLILSRRNDAGATGNRVVRRSERAICSEPTRRLLQRALGDVVQNVEGTGSLARVDGYPVAGKTGTAENPFGADHAWFVAYAPADAPEVAVAVIVENSGHGGSVAAPIVGEILHTYFTLRHADGDLPPRTGTR